MPETILVTGASGFIGKAVVHALLDAGYHVKAFVRATAEPFPHHPNLVHAVGDVRDLKSLEAAMAGVTGVMHLAAAKSDEKESVAINIKGTKNVIEVCRIAGVKRIVNISTQSAKLKRAGVYGSTKAEADRLFHASNLPVVTLRCSLVYATELSGVFGTIVRYSKLPFIPVFGSGDATYKPIHRDDLAAVIVHALTADDITGQIIDVGGPDLLTFNTVIQRIMDARGVRRPILHLPVWLGLIAASVLRILPRPPITVSNVLGGAENVPMNMELFERMFWTVPVRSFDEGLTQMFGAVPPRSNKEAQALLSYTLSSVGNWTPDSERIELFKKALSTHKLDAEVLDERIIHSRFSLSRYDAASRLLCPNCLLQKKLLIAAAIAETQPASAEALLPQNRSMIVVLLRMADLGISAVLKYLFSLPLLLNPRFLKKHAGAV